MEKRSYGHSIASQTWKPHKTSSWDKILLSNRQCCSKCPPNLSIHPGISTLEYMKPNILKFFKIFLLKYFDFS